MEVFLVGGAVRDAMLELPVRERDWVVVGATAEQLLAAGYRPVGADFPVFRHPQTGEEYALARRETKTGPGYRGFRVETGPDVTLEEDLARRDLTINAMAQDGQGRLIDPYRGSEDLQQGLLRHVTPAFAEDPVRLLRLARFAARFGQWGFRVAHGTQRLLRQMVAAGEVAHLQSERVWRELERALVEPCPWRFFEVLQGCGALAGLFPELVVALPGAGHRGAATGATLPALRRAAASGLGRAARFAATFAPVLGDAAAAEALCRRLRADRACRETLVRTLRWCPEVAVVSRAAPAALVAWLDAARAWQQPERLREVLQVCVALDPGTAGATSRIEQALAAAAPISAADLAATGATGREIRAALVRRRAAAVAAAIPAF